MVEVVGHKLVTHQPVIEPVSDARVRNEIFRCRGKSHGEGEFRALQVLGPGKRSQVIRFSFQAEKALAVSISITRESLALFLAASACSPLHSSFL